jgi:hypothetical protein
MAEILKIPFHGRNIVADYNGGNPLVALNPLRDDIGVSYPRQFRKLGEYSSPLRMKRRSWK